MQLTYWPMMGANRLDMGESLYRMLDKNVDHLIENAKPFEADSAGMGVETFLDCRTGPYPESVFKGCPCLRTYWLGNLPWALNNYWRHNRHAMDDTRLRDKIFPLLKRSINLYIHYLKTGDDGKLHIFNSISPEYTFYYVTDSNYDLALLRWGCQTLLGICARLNIADSLMAKWRDILENLTPYPTDANGLMVAAEWPFAKSHRHYSHLLAFYPLYLLNPEQEQDVPLLTRSVDHWTKLFKGGDDAGYSNTGAASMCAALGRGDEALMWLTRYRNITANAMESEHDNAVSEACFSGAQSVHDMLSSCWGDTIRIFPGVPTAWKDAVFHDMRTEGAFLISAQRKNGTTQWVRVKSLAGEPCRVKPSLPGKVRAAMAGKSVVLDPIGEGLYLLPLKKGEEILLYQDGAQPDTVVMPLPQDPAKCNSWGR